MIRYTALTLFAASFLVSCASTNIPYEPATKPERIEFKNVRLDVYPDDVRRNLDRYTNTPVAWVGVIRATDATEEDFGGKIRADTVFEHHYFDWEEDKNLCGVKLRVSPRGEGLFSSRWSLRKEDNDANAYDAQKYAGRGKLAIVYGVPEAITADGAIVLKYRYLRILNRDHFDTNDFTYGRYDAPKPGTQK